MISELFPFSKRYYPSAATTRLVKITKNRLNIQESELRVRFDQV